VKRTGEWREALRDRGEAGESLAEIMVAIAIIGIAVVVIVGSMAAAIALSTRHRQETTAGTVLLSSAEWVKGQPFDTGCPAKYAPPGGNGYSVATSVTYLDDSGTAAACSSTTNLQVVKVTVTAPSGYHTSVDVVKRNSA
jgi:type II secretory pathway pseudopilin PulG